MKENRKSLVEGINWKQMPLLRALVFVQVGIAVIFSLIAMLIAIYFVNERSNAIQNSRKLDLIRMMSANHEKIRLWSSLGMKEASSLVLQDTRKIEYIKNIDVKNLNEKQFKELKEDKHLLVIPEKIDNHLPYYLIFELDSTNNSSIASALIIPIVILLFIFALIYSSIAFIMKKIFKPLSLLISDDLGTTERSRMIDIEASGEMGVLISKIQSSQRVKIQLESEKMNFKLATQLAHDIRSPLEVLKGLKDEMSYFPDSTRKRIQLSINRIEEITFNLLKTHKEVSGITPTLRDEDILSILISTITEKNIEFRNHENVELRDNLDSSCFGIFSRIDRAALKSILSNLINNSVESIGNASGSVKILLSDEGDKCLIKILDTGLGIPDEVANKLFTKGFTTKKTGNGIGLYNAKQDIEAVGGAIDFESTIGKGTTFTISLPKSETPPTFISSIDAYKYERIIVLDDDPAFHEVWNKRLEGLESKVEHIHSVEEMLTKYQALHLKILLLSDFELMDKEMDGIDTILKLNHAEHSVLVTARNEEQAIQDRCLKAGIKLLPKSLVNYVKVISDLSESSKHIDASKLGSASMVGDRASELALAVILIDDDKLVHLNWASHCKKNGLPFCGFKSVDEFLVQSPLFDPDSRIYIDSNLGDGIKGEIESEKIFQLGFLNLYIATGYEKESIQKTKWIKEIYSKSPGNIS